MESEIKMSPECATLFKALRGFMAECTSPRKRSTNPHFKSMYANLEEVLDTAKPVLDKHELTLTQFPCGGGPEVVGLTTLLAHDSGQWMMATVYMPLAKRDPQAAGSALTYARRYGAMAVLGMAAEDDDGEQASGRGKQDAPPKGKGPRTLDDVAAQGVAAERPKAASSGGPNTAAPMTAAEPLVLYPRTGEMLPRSEVVAMHNRMSEAYHKKMKLKPGAANAHGLFEPNVPMPKMPNGKHEGSPVGIVPAGYLREVTMRGDGFLGMDPGLVIWVSYACVEHELERPEKEAASAAE